MKVTVWSSEVYVLSEPYGREERQKELKGTRQDSGVEFCFRVMNV